MVKSRARGGLFSPWYSRCAGGRFGIWRELFALWDRWGVEEKQLLMEVFEGRAHQFIDTISSGREAKRGAVLRGVWVRKRIHR